MVDYQGTDAGDLFDTPDDAAVDFARTYGGYTQADGRERGAMIYKKQIIILTRFVKFIGGRLRVFYKVEVQTKYYYGTPFKGGHDNVLAGLIANYFLYSDSNMVGFVHSHPNCICHKGNSFSRVDGKLLSLPYIDTIYLLCANGNVIKRNEGSSSDTIIDTITMKTSRKKGRYR